jgi:histidine triad (HIT) family protein
MSSDCLFCRIVAGEIPATRLHEDDQVIAIRDIAPKAPTHVLVMPRRHIDSIADLGAADAGLAAHLMAVAADIARAEGVEAGGYRIVANVGRDGGQTVPHLHLHLLGGRALAWPPG